MAAHQMVQISELLAHRKFSFNSEVEAKAAIMNGLIFSGSSEKSAKKVTDPEAYVPFDTNFYFHLPDGVFLKYPRHTTRARTPGAA